MELAISSITQATNPHWVRRVLLSALLAPAVAAAATKTVGSGEVHTATDADVAAFDSYAVQAGGLLRLDLSSAPTVRISGAGEVRKVSAGTWTYDGSSTAQADFAGRFVLAAGIVQFDDDTPVAALGGASSVPVVTNGATLVMNTKSLAYARTLHLSGTGARDAGGNDLGALRVLKANGNSNTGLKAFSLDGDATVHMAVDYIFLGGSGVSGLNGHRLLKTGKGIIYFYSGSLKGDDGTFELAEGTSGALTRVHLRDNYDFGGPADGPLVLNDYTCFALQNDTRLNRPVRVAGRTSAILELNNQYKDYTTGWTESTRVVGGPVTLETGSLLTVRAPNAQNTPRSLNLGGRVSGAGDLTTSGSGRVYVSCPSNDFTGTLTVDGVSGGETYLTASTVLPDYAKLVVTNRGRVALRLSDDDSTWPLASIAALARSAVATGDGAALALDLTGLAAGRKTLDFSSQDWRTGGIGLGAEAEEPGAELTVLGPVAGNPVFGAWTATLRFAGRERFALGTVTSDGLADRGAGTVVFEGGADVTFATNAPMLQVGKTTDGRVTVRGASLHVPDPEQCSAASSAYGQISVGCAENATALLDVGGDSAVTGRLAMALARNASSAVRIGGGEFVAYGGFRDESSIKSLIGSAGGAALLDVTGGVFRCLGYMTGANGAPAVVRLSGGRFELRQRMGGSVPFFDLPRGNCQGDFYQTGGTADFEGYLLFRGGGNATLTLDGPAALFKSTQSIQGGYNATTAYHMQVNLNAGVLEVPRFGMRFAESQYKYATPYWVTFNGGTFRTTGGGVLFPTETAELRGLDRVTVFAGGATIENRYDVSTGLPLQGATGQGIVAIEIPAGVPTTGYAAMPSVSIEGDGQGASAVAVYDLDRREVTGIRVTCPGWDYTTATARLTLGTSNAVLACRLAANANTGAFAKKGAGVLTISQASTYGGDTVLAGGTLKCGADGAIPTGSRVVLAGGRLDMNGKLTGDGEAQPTRWGVDAARTLVSGAGTYDGQLFREGASLTVTGLASLPFYKTSDPVVLLTLSGSLPETLPQPVAAGPVAEGWTVGWDGNVLKATPQLGDYRWTGAADGYWTNAANWTVNGEIATRSPGVRQTGTDPASVTNDYAALQLDTDVAIFDGAFERTTVDLDGLFSISNVTVTGLATPQVTFGAAAGQPLPIANHGAFVVTASAPSAPRLPFGIVMGKGNLDSNTEVKFLLDYNCAEPLHIEAFFGDVKSVLATGNWWCSTPRFTGGGDLVFDCDSSFVSLVDFAFATTGTVTFNGNLSHVRRFAVESTPRFVIAEGKSVSLSRNMGTELRAANAQVDALFTGGGAFRFSSCKEVTTYNSSARTWYDQAKYACQWVLARGARVRFDGCRLESFVQNASYDDRSLLVGYYATSASTAYGTLDLVGTNDIAGAVKVYSATTLRTSAIGAAGTASPIGSGSEIVLARNGALAYSGAGETTTRPIAITNMSGVCAATLAQEGTGVWRVASPIVARGADATLTLANDTDVPAVLETPLGDTDDHGAVRRLSVVKTGSGLWTVAGSNTFSGTLTVGGGTLAVGADGSLGNVSELVGAGGTLEFAAPAEGVRTVDLPPVRFTGLLNLAYDPKRVTVRLPSRTGTAPRYLTVNGRAAAVGADGVVRPDDPVPEANWERYPVKWFLFTQVWYSESGFGLFRQSVEAAAACGYNAVVLQGLDRDADGKDAAYQRYLGQVVELCDRLDVEVIPYVWSCGWRGGLDANAIEAYSPIEVPFVARDGQATVNPFEAIAFENGGFEELRYSAAQAVVGFKGWSLDAFGKLMSCDTETVHGGTYAVLADLGGQAPVTNSMARTISDEFRVPGGRLYRADAWFRAEGLAEETELQLVVYADGKWTAARSWRPRTDGEWEKVSVYFDLKADATVRVYTGTWTGRPQGRFWVDDVKLTNITHRRGVVRRDGVGFSVRSAATGRVYEEGVDYAPVAGLTGVPQIAQTTDETPELTLTLPEGSAIADGEELVVTYSPPMRGAIFDAETGKESYYAYCMSNPPLWDEVVRSAKGIARRLNPRRWFLNVDEIRCGGTCEQCLARHTDMAHILADFMNHEYRTIRSLTPDAEIWSWSDMLCPHHNAHDDYYNCLGTYAGVWELIPKDILIMDWYHVPDHFQECEDFFRTNGFRTACGGYYDQDDLIETTNLVEIMNTVPGELGFMYCTWKTPPRYEFLAGISECLDGIGRPTFLECRWIGGASGEWSDPANWDKPPEPRAVVTIPQGATVRADEADLKVIDLLKELVVDGQLWLDAPRLPKCAVSGSGRVRKNSGFVIRLR